MHAGFPQFQPHFFETLTQGEHLPLRDSVEGELGLIFSQLAAGLLEDGLGALFTAKHLRHHEDKALAFLRDQVIFQDGVFQGKYLIRTRKPGDNFNVFLEFCPRPQEVAEAVRRGRLPDPSAFLRAAAMREAEADALERTPGQVDLVIRFRDIESIRSLIGPDEVDVVSLLLQNTVQLMGNLSYLFKLGAVGAALQQAMAIR